LDEIINRALDQMFDRAAGPFHLRFILQPIMATLLAINAGLKDAKARRPAYLWTLFSQPAERRILIEDGWKDIGRVFAVAFVVDAIYQFIVLRWFYPVQSLIVAFALSAVPYVLIRGPVTRICRAPEGK